MKLLLLALSVLCSFLSLGQNCTTAGQNPSTAFPVCGTSVFKQQSVPLCGGRALPSYCTRDGVTDTNPFWYKFTCFEAGTLGFLITPNNLGDDYDWELYDITGHNPNEVFTDGKLSIACNWSGEKGLTGTVYGSTQSFVCAGLGQPLFSKEPQLIKDHNYILLVSHFDPFTNSTEGYTLDFKGGTAIITDPRDPHLTSATAGCGGETVRLKLNKRILCRSIEPEGSDFYIDGHPVEVIGARGIGCSEKFDTDSIEITVGQPLPAGDYVVKISNGSDNNTLLDICENNMSTEESMPFKVLEKFPTPMDSLIAVTCAPNEIKLVFSRNMLCNSIAADGSDFQINGTYPVTVLSAEGDCQLGSTRQITIRLSTPLTQRGDFTVQLRTGSDGNTIIDECLSVTPAGSSLPFSVKDTVNADFGYSIQLGCEKDLVNFSHPGKNEVNSWTWNLDDNFSSNLQNPQAAYTLFNTKRISLFVSNGFCSDSSFQTIVLDNYLKADFTVAADNCPLDPIPFTSQAEGKVTSHFWDFGDGATSNEISPTHSYERFASTRDVRIRYSVTNEIGCTSSTEKTTRLYVSCIIDIPNAFTPNGDGINDLLYPLNAVKADRLTFTVFNRWGQQVFKTDNWKKGWDGSFQSRAQESGTYIWTLTYTDPDSKKQFSKKGTALLIR